jgi:hypothetical protein
MGEKVVIASPLKLARPRPVAFLSGPFPRAREATALFRPCHANRRVTPSPNLAHSSMGQTARLSVTATTKRWHPSRWGQNLAFGTEVDAAFWWPRPRHLHLALA